MISLEEYMKMSVDELQNHLSFLSQSYVDVITYSHLANNPMAARSLALQGEALKKDFEQCKRVYYMRLKQKDIEEDFDELEQTV